MGTYGSGTARLTLVVYRVLPDGTRVEVSRAESDGSSYPASSLWPACECPLHRAVSGARWPAELQAG